MENNKRRLIACMSVIVLILFIIPEIYLYPLFLILIKPAGEEKIEEITAQISKINETHEKLEKIAEWESENFTNAYGRKIDFPLWRYPIYFDSGIKVRAFSPITAELVNNPQWIAFFKVGGCGELASLFNEVAKRAGIETRIVGTVGEDHEWNEVKIDNEWIPADSTIFFNYHSDQNIKWLNNSKFYESNWFNISKVLVTETQEDITLKYTDTGVLRASFVKPTDRVIVRTIKNGELRDVLSHEVNSTELEIELGGKNYNVTAEKDVLPYFIVLQETKEVGIVEGSNYAVQLSPKQLGFKPWFYLTIGAFVYFFILYKLIKRKKTGSSNKK